MQGCSAHYMYALKDPSVSIYDANTKALSQRHMEFWELFAQKHLDKTYDMELPHLRFEKSLEWYREFNAGNEKNYTITQLSFETVDKNRMIVRSRFQNKEGTSYVFPDYWVLVEGKWYHFFEFSKLPSPNKPF